MALDRPYCSVEDVQRETLDDDANLTPWYEECINRASRWVEAHTGKSFWFHNHVSGQPTLKGKASWVLGDMIALPFPILSLTKVWIYTDRRIGKTDSDLLLVNEHWYVEDEAIASTRGVIRSCDGAFAEYPFRGALELEGTFGYAITDSTTPPARIPPGVRRGTTLVAAALSGERHVEQIGLDGSRVELLDTAIPKEAFMRLRPFLSIDNML